MKTKIASLLIATSILALGASHAQLTETQQRAVDGVTRGVVMFDGVVYPAYRQVGPADPTPTPGNEEPNPGGGGDGEEEPQDTMASYDFLNSNPWSSEASLYWAANWLTFDHAANLFVGDGWQYLVPAEAHAEFVSTLLPVIEQTLAETDWLENDGYIANGWHQSGVAGLHEALIGGSRNSFRNIKAAALGLPTEPTVEAQDFQALLSHNMTAAELTPVRNALNSAQWATYFPTLTPAQRNAFRSQFNSKQPAF